MRVGRAAAWVPCFFVFAQMAFSAAPKAKTLFKSDGIEIFGTQKIGEAQIREKTAPLIEQYLGALSKATPADKLRAASLRKKLVDEVAALGEFPWTRLTEIETGRDGRFKKTLFLFDVIEKKDMPTRLIFRSAPKGQAPDPAGLLALWKSYSERSWSLVRSGQVAAERGECPAFFCPEGSGAKDESLAALAERIDGAVPGQKAVLQRILTEDADAQDRANALFLLAFLENGEEVMELAVSSLLDPEHAVREAAVSIIGDVAVYHKKIPIPIQAVVKLLDYPYPEDRTRALGLFVSLADTPEYESYLLGAPATQIIQLLRSRNPAVHEMAHTVLMVLSDESYSERDYDAWESWLWKERQKRAKGSD